MALPSVPDWSGLAERSAAVRFIDLNLRGAGQVVFQDNPIAGLLFLFAVAWGGGATGNIAVAIGAVVALVVANLTAMLLAVDRSALRRGLFGFNGLLVGAALPTFLAGTPTMWALLVFGAAVSTVAMLAVTAVMRTFGAPALTAPFVLTTWLLLLAAHSFDPAVAGMGPPAPGEAPAAGAFPLLGAWLKGPAQVFLVDDALSGGLVVLGLAVASLRAAGFALLGSAVAIGVAIALGADPNAVSSGLHGFSPVLIAVALGCVFLPPSAGGAVCALLATVLTVIAQAAIAAAAAPLGIPPLTAAFVLVTWLVLLASPKP
jgi:urea transporter